jgi:alginate O-acetyltransferase complex protein AlgJ
MQEPTISETPAASKLELWHRNAAAVALGLVVLAGAAQYASVFTSGGPLEYPKGIDAFRDGRMTTGIEKAMDKAMPQRAEIIAFANALRWRITGGANDQVRLGQDGWIFLTEEVQFDANAQRNLAERVAVLGEAARALQKKQVELVVAVVPDKARIYAQHLQGAYPAYLQSRYGESVNQLRAAGVKVVDLATPLAKASTQQQVYYRTDTHWSQNGANVAAQAIAQAVAPLVAGTAPTSYQTADKGAMAERPGDLLRLMGLESAPNAWRPLPDTEVAQATQQVSQEQALGLFGDAAVPVVLTGTSYSQRGNFHGYLQQALSRKVLNVSKDGGGFLQATTQYLKDEAFTSAPPTVLVWELPERFLYRPISEEAGWLASVGLKAAP